MRSHPKATRITAAIGSAGLLGLAFLAAPALGLADEDGPPREQPASPAPPARDGEEPGAVDEMSRRARELAERLGKQAEPVADELRKAIGDAAANLGDVLKRDDVSADDVRAAVERARDQLLRAFEEGGSIDRSAREAIRKAREEVRGDLEKSRDDARHALRRRYDSERERLRDAAGQIRDEVERKVESAFRDDPAVAELKARRDELRGQLDRLEREGRSKDDPDRKELKARLDETVAEYSRLWRERYDDLRARAEAALGSGDKDETKDEPAESDEASHRIRELQQQLREAQRELQRSRRPDAEAPRDKRPGPDAGRRLDALESKMDRVLKALEGLTADRKPEAEAEPKPEGE